MTTAFSEPKVLEPPAELTSFSERLTSFFNHLQLPPETFVFISAMFIGGITGLAMVVFHYLINLFQTLALQDLMGKISGLGFWTLACIPAAGGLIVGLIRCRWQEFFGGGISSLISSQRVQKLSPIRPLVKLLAAAISLGTGASLGSEGPSVEIGANFGIILGQIFRVSQERYRLLLGAGAAAGLAAGFNAPIAGVFFALEVVLGTTFAAAPVSIILLSAVVSSLIARIAFGDHPAFKLPVYEVKSNWELVFYLGLGLLASLISILYTQSIKVAQNCFQGKTARWTWLGEIHPVLHPVIGGACVGLAALQYPHILGIGYGTIEVLLQQTEQFPLDLLCILLVLKVVLTAISSGSGLVGGIFAPALFIGATLGSIYGNVLAAILPTSLSDIAPPPAYAMVGMAAVLAGSVKAPLTAILLLFEMTQNYLIILPLMAAVGVSVLVVTQIQAGLNPQQMGINLEKQDELKALQSVPIATLMQQSYLTLSGSLSVLEAGLVMINNKCHTALVVDEGEQLMGIITLADIRGTVFQGSNQSPSSNWFYQKLSDICTSEILYAYEDEFMTNALERMATRGLFLLPVVARDNPRKVLGIIEKDQITLAGDLSVTRETLRPYLDYMD